MPYISIRESDLATAAQCRFSHTQQHHPQKRVTTAPALFAPNEHAKKFVANEAAPLPQTPLCTHSHSILAKLFFSSACDLWCQVDRLGLGTFNKLLVEGLQAAC